MTVIWSFMDRTPRDPANKDKQDCPGTNVLLNHHLPFNESSEPVEMKQISSASNAHIPITLRPAMSSRGL